MKAITAHAFIIPTIPTDIGESMSSNWPTWTRVFYDPKSFGKRLMNVVGRPLEDFRQNLLLWRALSNPFSAESTIYEIVHGTSSFTHFPPELFKPLWFVPVTSTVIEKVVFTQDGYSEQFNYFPNPHFFASYKQAVRFTTPQDWCVLLDMTDQELGRTDKYLLFEKKYDSITIHFAADANHNDPYTRTVSSNSFKLSNIWDQIDEWGFDMGVERLPGEHDMFYARRLNDIFIHPSNATGPGIKNGVRREFGLLTNPGEFRLPILYDNDGVDVFGDPARVAEPRTEAPRILQVAKWDNIIEDGIITVPSVLATSEVPTTRHSTLVYYLVLRLTGPGHIVLTPVPDHVYGFASVGFDDDDTYTVAYRCVKANGKNNDQFVFDSNALTIEVDYVDSPDGRLPMDSLRSKYPGLTDSEIKDIYYADHHRAYDNNAYVILEYRMRVSSLMPEQKPPQYVHVRSGTFHRAGIPQAHEYLLQTMMSRVFAINETDYRMVHFEGFDGPADYSEERKAHYLGISPEAIQYRALRPDAYATWQRRHEAFNDITQQGMNRIGHERMAEIINDTTKVMWNQWRWGQGFWWEEAVFEDPNTILKLNTPGMERTLTFVPHLWDTEFQPDRKRT